MNAAKLFDDGAVASAPAQRNEDAVNASFRSENPNHRMTVGQVDPNTLSIDPKIQREANRVQINKIKRRPNAQALGTLTISIRVDKDGFEIERVILDGQQRWTAVQELGWDVMMNACIHKGLTTAEEVQLFLDLNDKVSVAAWEQFKVELQGNDPQPKQIKAILDNLGIPLGGPSGFVAVGAARRIADKPNGLIHLGWALSTLQAVYGKVEGARSGKSKRAHVYDGRVVEGFAMFHAAYAPRIKDDRLQRILIEWERGLSGLIGDAGTMLEMRGGAWPINVADVLVRRWNTGVKKSGPNYLPEFDRRPRPAVLAETGAAPKE